MDPHFFLPCFYGPRASRLGHKRKEKIGVGMLIVPLRVKIQGFGTVLGARDEIFTFAYSAVPFMSSSVSET